MRRRTYSVWTPSSQVLAGLLLAGCVLLPQGAQAELKLRQPSSPLNKVHADAKCEQCHVSEENMPSKLCLSCHKDIGQRQTQNRGLHGSEKLKKKECFNCHYEHRGPEADIRGWGSVGGKANFDHAQTGFSLGGSHAGKQCAECHNTTSAAGRPTFMGPVSSCTPCHAKSEPHQGSLGKDCLKCHNSEGWKQTRFDHDKDSRFPLRGKHILVAKQGRCSSCHTQAPKQFKLESISCGESSCHGKDDAHKGQLGKECSNCHSETQDWSSPTYSHNDPAAPNRFRLVGKHAELQCASCHKKDEKTHTKQFRGLSQECETCHAKDEPHNGQMGPSCGSCHQPLGWGLTKKEHDITPVKFGGAHDRVACATCHTAARKLRGTGNLCINCHQRDDIHHNALGPACGDCHTQQTFSAAARFRHETVGCTLRGVHRALPCIDCHKGGNYAGLSPLCASCHRDDAMRAAALGVVPELHVVQTACSPCHNTITFRGALTRQSPPESVCQ